MPGVEGCGCVRPVGAGAGHGTVSGRDRRRGASRAARAAKPVAALARSQVSAGPVGAETGSRMKYFSRVLRYLRPHYPLAVLSVLLMVLGALVGLLLPWPLKVLVANALGAQPMSTVLAWASGGSKSNLLVVAVVAGFLLAVLQHALPVFDNYVNTKIDQNIVLDFRSELFQHAQRLSLAFHDQRRSGSLIYAINYQADAAARLIMAVPPLVTSALSLIGMLWVTFLIDPVICLMSLSV